MIGLSLGAPKEPAFDPSPRPVWNEENCPETNNHVRVGKDDYMVSGDGFLMPTEKGQKAPDLKYFK